MRATRSLPRTGHIGLLTKPAEFAELVRRFVDETLQNFKPGTLLEAGRAELRS